MWLPCWLFIFAFHQIPLNSASQLLTVIVVHRHGDRNPQSQTYATDPYRDISNWPEGLGQLTKRGMQRQFDLGLWIRSRYAHFLPLSYSAQVIRAISTDVDRTLMSAELTLAALFPPLTSDQWSPTIQWRPIPIHTTPQLEDPFLAMKKPCPKYIHLHESLLTSQHFKSINEINSDLYQNLSNYSGENITSIAELERLHNDLWTEEIANKTLPSWTKEVYPHKMAPVAELHFRIPCFTPSMARLKTGLLFGGILKHFRDFLAQGNTDLTPKLLLLSGHDTTIANILTSLGLFRGIPPCSSALFLELHQSQNQHYINLIYKNSQNIFNLTLKECTFNCPFNQFQELLIPITINKTAQWEEECKLTH